MWRSLEDGIDTAHSSWTVSPANTVRFDGLATRRMGGRLFDSSKKTMTNELTS